VIEVSHQVRPGCLRGDPGKSRVEGADQLGEAGDLCDGVPGFIVLQRMKQSRPNPVREQGVTSGRRPPARCRACRQSGVEDFARRPGHLGPAAVVQDDAERPDRITLGHPQQVKIAASPRCERDQFPQYRCSSGEHRRSRRHRHLDIEIASDAVMSAVMNAFMNAVMDRVVDSVTCATGGRPGPVGGTARPPIVRQWRAS
jgi:hypothetical protein